MLSFRWIFFRVMIPLLLTAVVPVTHHFWPMNVALAVMTTLFLPAITALLHVFASSIDNPKTTVAVFNRSFRRKLAGWRALDGLACFMLMVFDITAIIAYITRDNLMMMKGMAFVFAPYLAISIAARWFLLKCLEISVTEILNAPVVPFTIKLATQ